MTCDHCQRSDGILELEYDLAAVREAWRRQPLADRALNHWRYAELLPLDKRSIPWEWSVGWTPLVDVPRLANTLGLRKLLCKDEGRNPTASFKDRASSVGVAHALQSQARTIACASTGNAATSLAGHAALAGLPAVIFVPSSAPEPKLAQLLIYGATVVAVQGSYDEAYRLCSEACQRFGWYNRNCAMNPVLVEGKKTGGLEIAEQTAWRGRGLRLGRRQRRGRLHVGRDLEGTERDACARGDRTPATNAGSAGGRHGPDQYALEHDQLPADTMAGPWPTVSMSPYLGIGGEPFRPSANPTGGSSAYPTITSWRRCDRQVPTASLPNQPLRRQLPASSWLARTVGSPKTTTWLP